MKAVILAAGKGVRMFPLTADKPKVLVEVNGKPFLWWVIDHLRKAGFTELGIIVGYKKEKIKEFLQNYNLKATLIEQKEPLGTGDAVKQARQFASVDNFLVYYGDNLISVEDLKSMPMSDGFHYTGGIEVEHPEKYGVLVKEKGFLKEIKEKPKDFAGNIINPGLYKFTPEIFSALENVNASPRGEIELTDAVTILAKQRKVKVIMLKDYWLDLGTKEDVEKVGTFIYTKKIFPNHGQH